jgi:spectinomycin phosphotransferase
MSVAGDSLSGMQDEPAELPADAVLSHVQQGWGLVADRVRYAPVGAGSYHWVAEAGGRPGWFVKCDVVSADGAFERLRATFETAAALRADGLEFVVAPVADRSGALLRPILPGWAMSIFPYLEGDPIGDGPWPEAPARTAAAGLVGRLHAAPVPAAAPRWTPEEALVSGSVAVLVPDLDRPWRSGPYGEPARHRLNDALAAVERLLDHYLQLQKQLDADDTPWVVTHGEPHSANVLETPGGQLLLIDWDSLRLAPREREFRRYLYLDEAGLQAYAAASGTHAVRPWACELFRAEWDLHEIGWYASRLRADHADTPDARHALERLTDYLATERHWPDL